jgi:methanogenic corrinoid protein MtbC1
MSLENFEALTCLKDQLVNLKEDESQNQVRLLLQNGTRPQKLKQTCLAALLEISHLYETGRYYLSAVLMSGRLIRKITALIHDHFYAAPFPSRVQLGSLNRAKQAQNKNLTNLILAAFGFETQDLGQEVTDQNFLGAQNYPPGLIGLFDITHKAHNQAAELVKSLKGNLTDGNFPRIFLYGNRSLQCLKRKAGVDYILTSTAETVALCHSLIMNYEPDLNQDPVV